MIKSGHNRFSRTTSVVLISLCAACLDRIDIDTNLPLELPLTIEGFVSNEPGPYTVEINQSFDLESKSSIKAPISAEKVVISDDQGVSEELVEITKGVYQTNPNGIRGEVGRAYKIQVQLSDDRIYESIPDTLLEAGRIDKIYTVFREGKTANDASTYGFDVMIDPSANSEKNYRVMWKFKGTYQADTNPELKIKEGCGEVTCQGCNKCNYKPLCSGIRNISSVPGIERAVFVRMSPCECCTCWYNFFNPQPILSEGQLVEQGRFASQKVMYIPLDPWIFQHRIHAKVSQFTLTAQAFDFWTAVRDQKAAINSLFQPVTGKIRGNFVQKSGSPLAVEGVFYAAGVASEAMFIERDDVPRMVTIPAPGVAYEDSCLKLAPYSTNIKPDFWN